MTINPNDIICVIEQALGESRRIIQHYFRQNINVDRKADASPVTMADKEAEAAIRKIITQAFPGHAILGEEHGKNDQNSDYCWVIDPIDGTKSFISGFPLFGTLIGLTYQDRPIVGVIDMPVLNERWQATAGSQTKCNSQICQVSNVETLQDAILYATEPNMFIGEDAERFSELAKTVSMRRFGGDCYNYAMLASGHVDLVVEADLKYHDVMSLVPIIEGAGGVISDWFGRPLTQNFDGRVIAASTPSLHRQVLAILK